MRSEFIKYSKKLTKFRVHSPWSKNRRRNIPDVSEDALSVFSEKEQEKQPLAVRYKLFGNILLRNGAQGKMGGNDMPKKPVIDKEMFKRSVLYNIKTLYRKTPEEATEQQIFQAVAFAVKVEAAVCGGALVRKSVIKV